jgi:glycosyltransferase involved in cell wall biosynthesis
MQIAFVVTTAQIGGAEFGLAQLLGAWPGDVDDLTVIALRDGPLVSEIRGLGLRVVLIPIRRGPDLPRGIGRLASVLRILAPDVIQGWMLHANVVAQASAALVRVAGRVVWSMRHSLDGLETESRRMAWLLRAMAPASRWPARILYNSRRSAAQHEAAGYDPSRTVIIRNGFDCGRFHPSDEARRSVRAELGVPSDVPLVGLVARTHPIKGHAMFLRAAATLASMDGRAHFVLVGRGTEDRRMREAIGTVGLTNRVHCLGERRDMPRITAALDVSACCSLGESFPSVIGEAMACGVPVATTDVGDCADLVARIGRVVAPKDAAGMAAAWADLLRLDPDARRRVGEIGRRRIATLYPLSRMAAEYRSFYLELVEQPLGHSQPPHLPREDASAAAGILFAMSSQSNS